MKAHIPHYWRSKKLQLNIFWAAIYGLTALTAFTDYFNWIFVCFYLLFFLKPHKKLKWQVLIPSYGNIGNHNPVGCFQLISNGFPYLINCFEKYKRFLDCFCSFMSYCYRALWNGPISFLVNLKKLLNFCFFWRYFDFVVKFFLKWT